ncbi:recombinase RecR [Kiloniella litopenaei]|uniref:Recombination protein RecR n=1 Tax=Kiloniella litopenaei TaxID=1549748 RepID=A0A0M2R7K6_9PROT|nr:recombination mediator RecR [Kiloniella litopenaei]KKJ77882.1 recombinase RecR [Kiloniella litopenaei]
MAKTEIDRLTQLLSRLPGLGPRSARRAVLFLMKKRESLMLPLAKAMTDAASSITNCQICGNLDTENPCAICQSPKRDHSKICVVEEVGDLWALERSGAFKGMYHVLGGTLSALDGRGPAQLNVNQLLDRAGETHVQEIILALSATVDGQTTGHYLTECLAGYEVEVSKLAHGVPVGGSLDYLDDGTLTAALKARRSTG